MLPFRPLSIIAVGLIAPQVVMGQNLPVSSYTQASLIELVLIFGSIGIGVYFFRMALRELKIPLRIPVKLRIPKWFLKHFEENAYEKGLAFEKHIVEKFSQRKNFFFLLEWWGDKYHKGTYAQSSSFPDLEYEFRLSQIQRVFSVECKYRSTTSRKEIEIMTIDNYNNYKHFHYTRMPVYIALGLRGRPSKPKELYLIPFAKVKLKMTYRELRKFRKHGTFYFDLGTDRLT